MDRRHGDAADGFFRYLLRPGTACARGQGRDDQDDAGRLQGSGKSSYLTAHLANSSSAHELATVARRVKLEGNSSAPSRHPWLAFGPPVDHLIVRQYSLRCLAHRLHLMMLGWWLCG